MDGEGLRGKVDLNYDVGGKEIFFMSDLRVYCPFVSLVKCTFDGCEAIDTGRGLNFILMSLKYL